MRIAAPIIWFLMMWISFTAIMFFAFGFVTLLFTLENCIFYGLLIASFVMVAGTDRETVYEYIDRFLDKLARR